MVLFGTPLAVFLSLRALIAAPDRAAAVVASVLAFAEAGWLLWMLLQR